MRAIVGLAAFLLAAAPARAEAPKAEPGRKFDVTVMKDVAYYDGKDASKERHRLDLYLPKGHKDFPVVFFIHGGGWRNGSKNGFRKHGEMFAKNGVGLVATNYRLTPDVQHPGHIQDVAKAFAWTVKNIGKHGGKAEEIFVSGHSAGGHLAALLAADESYLKAEKLSFKSIKGVIPVSGVFQIPDRLRIVFGDEDARKAASPLTHAKGKLPPMLLLYADKEADTLGKQADDFGAALAKAKSDAKVEVIKERDHVSIMRNIADEDDPATKLIFAFLSKHSGWKAPAGKAAAEKKD